MNYELSQHARDMLDERKIPIAWVERVMAQPVLAEPSARDATVESRMAKISEHGDRVLRVVVNKTVVPERIVSVYFDRSMKGKL